jgi:hypothetical protein
MYDVYRKISDEIEREGRDTKDWVKTKKSTKMKVLHLMFPQVTNFKDILWGPKSIMFFRMKSSNTEWVREKGK